MAEPIFRTIAANGQSFHVAEAGPADGPLVFLLHGFPEFWFGWRRHIEGLAQAGFHVVAPDQRGYNLSSKPRGVDAYALDCLAADVVALADAVGAKQFAVVGHDWGASVGWWLATHHGERLRGLCALNAPHPLIWLEAMRNDKAQRRKSRYVQILRLPALPEILLRAGNFRGLAAAFATASRKDAFSDADLARYREAWAQPGAIGAMINWYRALFRMAPKPSAEVRIAVPALVVWGDRDVAGEPYLAEASAKLCANAQVVHLADASHWVVHDEPEKVAALILDFLRSVGA
jgi:epoxide hydrolase 4